MATVREEGAGRTQRWKVGGTICWVLDECCCSVAESCPTLWDPIDCSMPSSSVLHYLPEFAQIHSIEPVMLPNYLTLCCPLLLPSTFPSIRVFSNESAFCIKWPKFGASASVPPMNIHGGFPLGLTGLILQSKGLSREFSSTTFQKHWDGLQDVLYKMGNIAYIF